MSIVCRAYESLTSSISIALNGTGKTWKMDINGHGRSWKMHAKIVVLESPGKPLSLFIYIGLHSVFIVKSVKKTDLENLSSVRTLQIESTVQPLHDDDDNREIAGESFVHSAVHPSNTGPGPDHSYTSYSDTLTSMLQRLYLNDGGGSRQSNDPSATRTQATPRDERRQDHRYWNEHSSRNEVEEWRLSAFNYDHGDQVVRVDGDYRSGLLLYDFASSRYTVNVYICKLNHFTH